jgi:hypothetical protein
VSQRLTEHTTKRRLFLAIGTLVLVLTGIKWSIGLPQQLDILFGDEAEYMRNGMDLFRTVRNDWGPTYNIWYKFLSLAFKDVIDLYYANYRIVGIAVAVLLYAVLVSMRIKALPALYISFCFFVSGLNMNTWPRISHFVLLIVLAGLFITSKLQSAAKKSLVLTIVCFICAYARPDLMPVSVVLFAASVYFMNRERKIFKSFIPYLIVLVLSVLFFQLVFGLPSSTYKGGLNRLYSAFCQHYSMNYKYRTGLQFDAVTEWISFCKAKFPDCFTIGDVISNHPAAFFEHVLFNLKNYLLLFITTLLSFIFPTGIYTSKKALLIAFILLTGTILAVCIQRERRGQFMALLKQHRFILLFLLLFGLPSMGMSVIIFPRAHYLLLHTLLFVMLIALLLQSLTANMRFNLWQFLGVCVLFLFIGPRSSDYKYMQFGKDMDNLCDQQLISFLEKRTDKDYVVFTNYLNITYILPKNYSEFSTEFELKRGMLFSHIAEERKINMILVSSNILENPMLTEDTSWTNLIAKPENYHFKKVTYSKNCDSYLLIKE